jgi:asparagine synthase (glutamine-hydrolysing)
MDHGPREDAHGAKANHRMCGITGAVWIDPNRALSQDVLARMTAVLAHRGPDGEGSYVNEFRHCPPYEPTPGVALGHRRLAIIDPSRGGQPMSNERGTVWLVFNGEIYNYRDLRRRLEGAGHCFRTECDTETIIHLYEDEGTDCFAHLNGMFALALWDADQRRLVLARDRLGKKPLVYRHEPGRLLFASELKSLLQVPGMSRDVDFGAVDEYLTYQYVPHPNTIFRGFKKLSPGHFAVYRDGHLDIRAYWRPDFNLELAASQAEYTDELRHVLESSVRLRMQSDVPLGAFLSGGTDSSLVVALMARQGRQPVKTFTIGFVSPDYDERALARTVARHVGAEHHEFEVRPDAVQALPKLIWQFDEPFADSSVLPTWYLSRLAREHVKVALTGDGGDELLAGYSRYRAVAWGATIDRWPWPLRSAPAARFWQWLPGGSDSTSWIRRWKRFSGALRRPPPRRYLEWIAIFDESRRAELYSDEFLANLPDSDPEGFVAQAWRRSSARDPVTAASLADLVTYLPCDLLTKVDMASMAHGLECRQPLLDYRLVELAIRMPPQYKYRWGRGKWILRQAMGNVLPRQIWERKKKGVGVPLAQWFRNELRDMAGDLLQDGQSRQREFFRPEAVARLFDEHQRGTVDHSSRLWALLVFEAWFREWGLPAVIA